MGRERPSTIRKRRADLSGSSIPRAAEHDDFRTPALFQALADASLIAGKTAARYALDHLQLRGRDGKIIATDGRHLLIQSGYRFPWANDLLMPANAVFACLKGTREVLVGRTASQVCLRAGRFTLFLSINRTDRYPAVDEVVPDKDSVVSRARLADADRERLLKAIPELPGGRDADAPLTLELRETVTVRARAEGEDGEGVLVMGDSRAIGKPVGIMLNRRYLTLALKLKLPDFQVVSAQEPVLFRDRNRLYVVMPLLRDSRQVQSPPAGPLSSSPPKKRINMPARRPRTVVSKPVIVLPSQRAATVAPPAPRPIGKPQSRPSRFWRSAVRRVLRFFDWNRQPSPSGKAGK